MPCEPFIVAGLICRSPCGERGLKFSAETQPGGLILSLPVRGAWVEMPFARTACHALFRRSPCGERGLKSLGGGSKRNEAVAVAPRAGSVG